MIEENNLFYTKLEFGMISEAALILANNQEDALETIQTYYEDPTIICLLSLNDIVEFLNSLKSDNDFLLLKSEIKENHIYINNQVELNTNKEALDKKYKDEPIFIINREELLSMRTNLVNEINNLTQDILISENYALK